MDFSFDLNFQNQSASSKEDLSGMDFDTVIIGGGPAGLNAALYAKRKGLEVAVVAKSLGGQVLDTSIVDNYLGIVDTTGEELVNHFITHAKALDIRFIEGRKVLAVNPGEDRHTVQLEDGTLLRTKTVILATGSTPRKLGVPGEAEYAGKGVAYCAICDAPLFTGKDVIIAGGGNSAVEAAIDLAKVAKSVTVVHRSQFRADKVLVDQLYSNSKVTVHLETVIQEIVGDKAMTGIVVKDKATGALRTINADGIFIEIGHLPNAGLYEGLVSFNEFGEVIVDCKNQTDTPGLLAAGDVTDTPYKQIIIATGDGAKAALSANEYINQHHKATDYQEPAPAPGNFNFTL